MKTNRAVWIKWQERSLQVCWWPVSFDDFLEEVTFEELPEWGEATHTATYRHNAPGRGYSQWKCPEEQEISPEGERTSLAGANGQAEE